MTSADVLVDAFSRVQEAVHEAVDGLDEEQLAHRIDDGANSIAWLVWHLARVQDDHIADVAEIEQVWLAQNWASRFALPLDEEDTGYGHDTDQVESVRAPGELLTGYYDAVHEQTLRFVTGLDDAELDEVIDASWSPPVTLGVRLVSVIADDLQHAGQAALLNGFLRRTA
ncbi:DinB family protein [Saccharopolyspora sp. TS4A08]|uniref:DinB family protein n=1 Tax=Saccharopolyspora ipomoeae TaxID=3042027 RepID=A0ABT6PKL7_9PSEU|nr:DinB family protein [Saccharopolyspora sp. TS4A08]MDI2028031.1 DinB family protein [Saccharopolyspora sp. TS4A08]